MYFLANALHLDPQDLLVAYPLGQLANGKRESPRPMEASPSQGRGTGSSLQWSASSCQGMATLEPTASGLAEPKLARAHQADRRPRRCRARQPRWAKTSHATPWESGVVGAQLPQALHIALRRVGGAQEARQGSQGLVGEEGLTKSRPQTKRIIFW